MKYKFLCIVLLISFFPACTDTQYRSLVVTDYVPAGQMAVPHFDKLQQAAENGNPLAQYDMGKLYADGYGVPKNHRTAMQWWNRAAIQGYAPAQYMLGWMYFNGSGVIRDFEEGCRWMRAAAVQGVPDAYEFHRRTCPQ